MSREEPAPRSFNDPILWLLAVFEEKRRRNHRFSLRAFARLLGLPSGRLSEILSHKRPLTLGHIEQISQALGISPQDVQHLNSLTLKQREAREKGEAGLQLPHQLEEDVFNMIAEGIHYDILGLLRTVDFQSEISWMARRLGVDAFAIKLALSRLERLGLIAWDGQTWRRTHVATTTSHDLPSGALRRSHREILERAMSALEEVEIEFRDITSMCLVMDPRKMSEAKQLIRTFRRQFTELMEASEARDVFHLNIQLVPVTKDLRI